MCLDPASLAIASGVAGLGQTYIQTKSQSAYYDAQAKADEQNAKVTAKQAELQADKYAQEQRAISDKAKLARGQASAAYGASGLEMAGSGLDIMSSIEGAYQEDKVNSLINQRADNYGMRVQETNFENSAAANKSASHNTKVQGVMSAIGTILSTASSVKGLKAGMAPTAGTQGVNPYAGRAYLNAGTKPYVKGLGYKGNYGMGY